MSKEKSSTLASREWRKRNPARRKKMRRVEDLSLAECNAIFDRLSEMFGVPTIQNAVILPELTPSEHATMLTQVLAQVEDVLS